MSHTDLDLNGHSIAQGCRESPKVLSDKWLLEWPNGIGRNGIGIKMALVENIYFYMKGNSPRVFRGNCGTPKCVGTPWYITMRSAPREIPKIWELGTPKYLGGILPWVTR